MHVTLDITIPQDYFNKVGLVVDYEEIGLKHMVSMKEGDAIGEILTTEVSLFMLRRSTGFCGSLIDHMFRIRSKLIKAYEEKYKKEYIEYNDFI